MISFRTEAIKQVLRQATYLIADWSKQTPEIKEKCQRETLMKGLLYLMNVQSQEVLMKLCTCCLLLGQSLYGTYKEASERSPDFYFVFNCLLNTVKVLYKCSKEATNDVHFRKVQHPVSNLNRARRWMSFCM